ncbi:LCP family protein [Gordonia otitidis]|nr:LCP family protein [Gordonia otitidis]
MPGEPVGRRRPRQRRSGEIHTTKSSSETNSTAPPPPPPPARGALATAGAFGRKAWGRGLVALVSVAVLVCTGYAWSSVNGLTSKITQLGGLGLGGADDGATDILLVGTDSRTDAKGNPLSPEELKWLRAGDDVSTNTDTILLIRIPNDGSSATAISIPRDSYVSVPGIGMSKINAAYGTTREGTRRTAVEAGKPENEAEREGTLAGRKALIDTVADLTGVKVDHYAEVGLLGFALLTKAVGGVDVCLKDAVNEPFSGARFHAGRQTLNGPQALSFVRQRHGLPRGDLDRITRQQVYMASLTQKILSAHTLTDPSKLNELEDAVSRSVVIDDDWNVVQFAEQLKDLSGGRVKFATIPVLDEHGWSEDGQQSVVSVDPNAVHVFTSNLLDSGASKPQSQRGDYTVDVDNAGTIDGLAGNVSNILTNKGFHAGKTSSTPADIKDSVIYAHSADNAGAQLLAKDLQAVRIEAQPDLDEHHLKLVLTNTFAGPGSIADTGPQTDNTPASARVGNNAPPITAGTDGPVCVN